MKNNVKRIVVFLLCSLLLSGCNALSPRSTGKPLQPESQPTESTTQVPSAIEPISDAPDKSALLDPFNGLFDGAELSVKKGSIGDEIHIATDFASDERPENWDEICDGVLVALESASDDPKTSAFIPAKGVGRVKSAAEVQILSSAPRNPGKSLKIAVFRGFLLSSCAPPLFVVTFS